jgi:hypothetical protein
LHVKHLSHIIGAHVLWHLLILMNLRSSIPEEVKYKNIQVQCGVCMLATLMFSLLEKSAHYQQSGSVVAITGCRIAVHCVLYLVLIVY